MAEYICPNCKKPIYDDEALLCLYCGESLRRGVVVHKIIITVIVIGVLLSFAVLIIK